MLKSQVCLLEDTVPLPAFLWLLKSLLAHFCPQHLNLLCLCSCLKSCFCLSEESENLYYSDGQRSCITRAPGSLHQHYAASYEHQPCLRMASWPLWGMAYTACPAEGQRRCPPRMSLTGQDAVKYLCAC